ncbi:N-acetyltransferase family protein [Paracrocinitomix mangrovi]|uniref:GNAT family N-acetyltransferase n=1 Tax=Paracrocinitomix mangrovi TaxID=2862509 RepID=UPI001C8E5505|nr:GNAT family N-acetyltransferase [Paracrocinitomix mangrovi]UKN03076.1 N-acetyltransferase family protein [Paracrocinitomix mangrovi]
MTQPFTIRPFQKSDVKQILDIYNYYILNSTSTFEEKELTVTELSERIESITKKYPYLVYEVNGEILGYAYANIFRTRVAYRYSVETSVYVHKDHFRKGIGLSLYKALIPVLKEQGFNSAIGGLTLPNDGSIKLHEMCGFKKIGEFKEVGFKFGNWYGVGFWQLMLQED